MSRLQSLNYAQLLYKTAKLYKKSGYSVIPVYGDLFCDKAKIAGVNWKQFQKKYASDQQIKEWFEISNFGGLAIITGKLSQLLVIDFDSAELEDQFKKQFPLLQNTYIVQSATRCLSHYYYSISENIDLPTLHLEGADLLSDGAYVIAPPTIINSRAYEIKHNQKPFELTPTDSGNLINFFRKHSSLSETLPETIAHANSYPITLYKENLVSLYKHYAPQIGRNNALFKVACYGRNHHLSEHEVKSLLSDLHVNQHPNGQHAPETEQARLRETYQTVKSAFQYPPQIEKIQPQQLTNSIREGLLQRGLTCVARVLDGLFMNDFMPGMLVTKKLVIDTLKNSVGKHSIRTSFNALIDDKYPIFSPVNPSPKPLTNTTVAKETQKQINKKCFLFTPTNSDKNKKGRKPTYYLIPDLNVLCQQLKVPFTRSDHLDISDIHQAKTYRQAVHQALIKRRPGMYHRYWLAQRIGVSQRTSQRYDIESPVQRQPMFIKETITWSNLYVIPDDETIKGRFLEDTNGKRYPALRQIAVRLLSKKHTVKYCYQDTNYYWYGDNLPQIEIHWGINPKQQQFDEQLLLLNNRIHQYWENLHSKKHVKFLPLSSSRNPMLTDETLNQSNLTHITKHEKRSSHSYHHTLLDVESEKIAQRLYQVIWDKATNEKSRISIANARRLIDEYDRSLIYRGLSILKSRKRINNPAGFIIVWLRSTVKGLKEKRPLYS